MFTIKLTNFCNISSSVDINILQKSIASTINNKGKKKQKYFLSVTFSTLFYLILHGDKFSLARSYFNVNCYSVKNKLIKF